MQTHQDNVKQNVLLQLLALVGKQPAFHQLRSVEQLGYIALLRQRYGGPLFYFMIMVIYLLSFLYCVAFGNNVNLCLLSNDSGVRGLQFIIQSTVKVIYTYFIHLFLT